MLTEERKQELMDNLAYCIDRYLEKQNIVSDLITTITEDPEEKDFLFDETMFYASVTRT